MKCIVIVEDLQKKILIAERFTGRNITLPILGNIFFDVQNNKIKIIATNLEIACVLYIPVKNIHEGIFTVQAHSFSSYLQTLPKGEKIIIEEKNTVITLETNTIQTKIITVSAKDFPLIPKIKSDKSINFSVGEFQQALKEILAAASLSNIKPELNGVYVQWNKSDHILTLAATDTFRLAEKKIVLKKEKSDDFSFILPLRSAQELVRFETEEEEGEMLYGESQVKFSFGNDEIISNTTNGLFPQYSAIIPKKFDIQVEVDRKNLIDAIKSTSFFSSKLQDIVFQVKNKDALEIHSENSEIGETTITLPATVHGKSFRISFSHKFFLDGLAALSGDKIVFFLNNEFSPALLKNAMHNSLYMYLIMPIKGV